MQNKQNQQVQQVQKITQLLQQAQVHQPLPILPHSNPVHQRLHIVRQCREHGLVNLDKYNVKQKRGVRYPNLIEFRYLQKASFKNPICRQARGTILDEANNYSVVALPYYKFFDYNDTKYSQLKDFDFKNYKFYEKFDGSIAFLYFYNGQWHMASSSVPDGEGYYYTDGQQARINIRTEFWRIFNQLKYQLPRPQDQNKTFVFELMSINHIIVCRRQKNNLVLHGVRNVDTLQEQNHLIYQEKYGWNVGKPIELVLKDPANPIAQIVQITEKLDPIIQEGFILCDHKYTRLKVKSSNYLRMNWLSDLNAKNKDEHPKYIFTDIVLAGQAQLFAQNCPEWKPLIEEYCSKIQKFNTLVVKQYELLKNLQQKQFALEAKKKNDKIAHFLFLLKKDFDLYKGRMETVLESNKFYDLIQSMKFD